MNSEDVKRAFDEYSAQDRDGGYYVDGAFLEVLERSGAMAKLRRACAGEPEPRQHRNLIGAPNTDSGQGLGDYGDLLPPPTIEYEDADAVIDWPYVIIVAGLALLAALLVAGCL